MNLLLDSCTLIWLASESGRLSEAVTAAINDPASALHVSHASLWEITLKHGAGKLALPRSAPALVERAGAAVGIGGASPFGRGVAAGK